MALTRAKQICFIMGPLDMRGLVGAATVIGCLKYGACLSGLDGEGTPRVLLQFKDTDLHEAPYDSAFLQSLRISCSRMTGGYPPLAMAEAFLNINDPIPRVRRLHLIIVDLKRRGRLAHQVRKQLARLDVVGHATQCLNTLPVVYKQDQPDYQLRYVFGYAMDGTDLPCYILWPVRTNAHFCPVLFVLCLVGLWWCCCFFPVFVLHWRNPLTINILCCFRNTRK